MSSASLISGTPALVTSVKSDNAGGTPPVIATLGTGSVSVGGWTSTGADVYIYKADSTGAEQWTTYFRGAAAVPAAILTPALTWSANVNSSGIAGWTVAGASQTTGCDYGFVIVA